MQSNSMQDEFFRAYGNALFAWQEVETALFKLYHSMSVRNGERDIMKSASDYYDKKTFGQKLGMVDSLVKKVSANSFIDWESLKSDLRLESKRRNILAHSPAHLVTQPDGAVVLEVVDQEYLPLTMSECLNAAFPYNADGCWKLCSCFKNLAQRVDKAFELIRPRFVSNNLVSP